MHPADHADRCVLLCAVAIVAACAPRDLALTVATRPRVIAIAPSSSTISLQPSFSIEFSSAMNKKTIDTDPNSKTL